MYISSHTHTNAHIITCTYLSNLSLSLYIYIQYIHIFIHTYHVHIYIYIFICMHMYMYTHGGLVVPFFVSGLPLHYDSKSIYFCQESLNSLVSHMRPLHTVGCYMASALWKQAV